MNTSVIIRVECDEFLYAFPDAEKTAITDKKILRKFEQELTNLKIDSAHLSAPDTRIKLHVYKDEQIETFCIGQFTITDGEQIFVFPDSFKKLLREIGVMN
jgi:hypothetical protein